MHTFNLSGSQVAVAPIEKDLGVHVSNLLWSDHIDFIIGRANKMLGMI